jgi:hypothetical protein
MRDDSNTQSPEHFLDEEEPSDDSAESPSACSETDSNFETGPRVDFESTDEPL